MRMTQGWRWLLLVIAGSTLVVSGCNDHPGDSSGETVNAMVAADGVASSGEYAWDGPVLESATIAYIGNFRGFLKPCGCAIQQSGGLLRLGTVLAELNERYLKGVMPGVTEDAGAPGFPVDPSVSAMGSPFNPPVTDYSVWPEFVPPHPVWLIECGNYTNPGAHYPAERVKTHLNALATLKQNGFIAAVIGSMELQLPADEATEAFADAPVRLTSCNLTSNLAGVVVEPWVEITAGWYLVGVTAWSGGPEPEDAWWELADPLAAVESTLGELPDGARVVLVAQHQPGEVIRNLATLPITVMIGHGSQNDPQWTADLARSFPPPPGKGIRLKLIDLDSGPDTADAWDIPLTEEWKDDEVITGLIEGEKDRIREKLLATLGERDTEGWRKIDWGSASKYMPDRQGTLEAWAGAERAIYIGSRECKKCHPDCHQVWKKTTHSHALLSLIQKDEHETLDCLQCHVAGLLEPSGYDPFTSRDEVAAVTCEACHGPASKHVALISLADDPKSLDSLEIIEGSLDSCLGCHDSYNSPDFNSLEYWREIAHIDTWQHQFK